MSSSTDDRSVHLLAQDDLAAIALGEGMAAGSGNGGGVVSTQVAEHVTSCPACQSELTRLRRLVDLARDGGRDAGDDDGPPRELWDRIAAQAEVTATASPAPAPLATPTRRRRAVLAAAAVVAVVGAGLGGWALGRTSSPEPSPQAVVAQLDAQPGTTTRAAGTATMLPAGRGYEMQVRTSGLPAPAGFYEVWLYDPGAERMVAVGTLGPGGRGSFTLPSGLDVRRYDVVDVSAQRYDGNPSHQRSVLRGPLDR